MIVIYNYSQVTFSKINLNGKIKWGQWPLQTILILIWFLRICTIKIIHCGNFFQNYCTYNLQIFVQSSLYSGILHLPFWQSSLLCNCHYRSWADYYLLACSRHCGESLVVLCTSRTGHKYPTDVLRGVELLRFFLRISLKQTCSFDFVTYLTISTLISYLGAGLPFSVPQAPQWL